jgi:hypothetical protein
VKRLGLDRRREPAPVPTLAEYAARRQHEAAK